VDGSGLGEAGRAGVGERDNDLAPVGVGGASPDEALVNESGHAAGHARARDQRPRCEFGHAQVVTGQ